MVLGGEFAIPKYEKLKITLIQYSTIKMPNLLKCNVSDFGNII